MEMQEILVLPIFQKGSKIKEGLLRKLMRIRKIFFELLRIFDGIYKLKISNIDFRVDLDRFNFCQA